MNYAFCHYKCGKCEHVPVSIIQNYAGDWYLGPDACQGGFVRIEPPEAFIKKLPDGWGYRKSDEFYYIDCKLSKFVHSLWDIHLHPDCGCPFFAEHFMSDIRHCSRIKDWSEWNDKMKERYAKADCKKLP